ncbi:MAG TPA: FimV/HubP family polar landmark protein [Gammaproteobacteria bacterium]|nr:FimV/HubP family polar landmark protein [Gammaproteobacteria bacterium]
MRSLARWGCLPLLAAPLSSWALSLGEIEANSFLNQPLNAEIPFTATPQELATLSVSMAPATEFLANGLEYPAFLSSIEFEVGRNASGQSVIIVRSRQAIAEPFLTMRVAVTHARGGFTREYSVFLDPPLFRADQAAPEPITAPVTRDPAPDVTRAPIERPAPAPQPQPQPAAPQPSAQPSSAAPQPVSQSQSAPAGDYTVLAGDTLWSIANRYRPGSVSTNQAMISIFEANAAAFDGNINRLRRGAILRIPPSAQLASVPVASANAEVQRQIEAWQNQIETSPQLVLLPPSESAAAPGASVPGAESSARIDALEGEVTDLESNLADTEAELAEARRLLELRDAELANLQRDLAAREAEPVAGADLEAEQLFVDEDPAAEAAPPEPVEAEAPVEAEPEPAPAESAPPLVVVSQDAGPSLVDRALEWIMNPIVAIGGGALVVLIAALAFLRRRRDVEDVTGQWEALEAELDDETDLAATARIRAKARKEPDMVVVEGLLGDETFEEQRLSGTAESEALDSEDDFDFGDAGTAEVQTLLDPDDYSDAAEREPDPAAQTLSSQTLSSQTVIDLDQADPIAEADFHMAYGLYDQAADLISKALKADPDNHDLKLKLIEVYFVWGNKEQFQEAARSLRADGGTADWDKVVIMGKQICPDDPLFADATASAGEVDLDLAGGAAGLDFPFAEGDGDDVDLDLGLVDTGELSLAQSGVNKTPRKPAADDIDMLDIGARTQAGLEAALLEDMDDEGEKTTPGGEIGDLDATMESPTISTETRGLSDELTLESPTVESLGPDAPTVETPTIETPAAGDEIGDTVEHLRPDQGIGIEMTAEIEIDDLGLEIGDLDDVPNELTDTGTVERSAYLVDADDELLSATGVTQVLDEQDIDDIEHTGTAILGDEDATMMAPGFDSEATGTSTAVLEQQVSHYDPDPPSFEDDLDLNLDDFSIALEGADTAEHPMTSRFGSDLDLDIGIDVPADDEPTGTEEVALDPQTMTEVGTKLDLARAYIDMGDPDGAKSILEEVLSEGDAGQRSEAKALIQALPAA